MTNDHLGADAEPPNHFPELHLGDDPKSKLLEAGWQILLSADGTILEGGFNPGRIALEAGVSRRTFYRHFPDKHDYVMTLFDAMTNAGQDLVRTRFLDALPESSDLDDMFGVIETWAQRYWDEVVLVDSLATRLSLLELSSGIPGVLDNAKSKYDDALDRLDSALSSLFDLWDVEPKPPWTHRQIVIVVGAIADGGSVRRAFHDERFDRLLSSATTALALAVLRPKGGRISGIDDVSERMADEVRRRWSQRQEADESLSASTQIDEALIRVLEERSVAETTIEAVAVRAGLSAGTVRAKGTIEEQVCGLVQDLVRETDKDLYVDVRSGDFTRQAALDRQALRFAELVRENRTLFHALLELSVVNRSGDVFAKAFGEAADALKTEFKATSSWDPDLVVAQAEQIVVSELFNWPTRQMRER